MLSTAFTGIQEQYRVGLSGISPEEQNTVEPYVKTAQPLAILGVPFDNVTLAGALDRIDEMVASQKPHYVVTANVDFLVQARHDIELRRILLNAHLVLCDGTPLVWASRFLANPLAQRVAGSDLVPELLRVAAQKKYRLFFLGATEEANAQAVANVRARFPGINVVGNYSPPFRSLLDMDHEEIARQIQESKPDILLVAFGCPKAEKWISMHYRSLNVPVAIGVGATIDFLAGRFKRAPLWMRRAGVEWLHRLCQEPRRLFKRYVGDLWEFSRAILTQWWSVNHKHPRHCNPTRSASVLVEPTWQRLEVSERLDAASIEHDRELWERLPSDGRHCLLDSAFVKSIDSTGVAVLLRLQKKMRESGHHMILLSPSASIRRALRWMNLGDVFDIAENAVEARCLIEARTWEQSMNVMHGKKYPLAWQGEITAANVNEVSERTVARLLRPGSSSQDACTIDLSRVRFIDTSAASTMMRMRQHFKRRIRFTGATASVRNVLHLSKIEGELEDALA